jgi:hypothetical protein
MVRAVPFRTPAKDAALERILGYVPDLASEIWRNDKYVCSVERDDDGHVKELSIRRDDRSWPRDWRDFQRIKNEIAGPEVEAVELFPAESRLYDTANQFWLWCLPPGEKFSFGFHEGRHVSNDAVAVAVGARQRHHDHTVTEV